MDGQNMTLREFAEHELRSIAEHASGTFNNAMKPEVFSCDEERMELTLKFPVLDWERNGLGMLHGGVLSAMADFTMSLSVQYFAQSAIPPTISYTMNYIRPVPADSDVLILCKVTSVGKRVGTAFCDAVVSNGKRAATATGTYSISRPG